MDGWKYIDAKEAIPNYDQSKSAWLEIFLGERYKHINGRNINEINSDIAHQVQIHSYKTSDGDLLITRRKEQSYSLDNHKNINIKHDEIILHSRSDDEIKEFIKELKEEFL